MTKPILASWSISLYFDCPHCGELTDATDNDEFYYRSSLKIGEPGQELEVYCNECKQEVTIKTVW